MLRQYRRILNLSAFTRLITHQPIPHQLRGNCSHFQAISELSFFQHARFATNASTKSNKYSEEGDGKDLKEAIASHDSDTFGSLSPDENAADDDFTDPGDLAEEKFMRNPKNKSRQLTREQYANIIKEHLKFKRYKEAIDVLEVQIKEDGHRPNNYLFNLVINACAQVGYTKKAFNLFTRMRQRGLLANDATYTSLFNACANGPYKQEALEMATRVREIMLEKNHEPNSSHYNVMIKAFGRLGDLKTAFQIVDEMLDKHLPISTTTYNFMLQACASDKEFGFRHSLLVWHKMYQQNLSPDIYSFNLMLRCCRDTELGDVATTKEVIETILLRNPHKNSMAIEQRSNLIALTEGSQQSVQLVDKKSKTDDTQQSAPNLLIKKPYLGNLIEIKQVKRAEDRLTLIGGFNGVLELMESLEVKPDLKTFSLLIELIPSTRAAENNLLRTVRRQQIKCDVDFFNILMKKRSMRFDYEGALEVLDQMIRKAALKPDIVTYGVMALGCQTRTQAWELINEMNDKGIMMNMPILGAMVKQGCFRKNFAYILDILRIIKQFKMKPSIQLMETLETFIKGCNYEKKKDSKNLSPNFRENVKKFKENFQKWKVDMGIGNIEKIEDVQTVLKEKPWDQFQEAQPEGYEEPKNQQIQRRRKLAHHIKMIKTRDVLIKDVDAVKVPRDFDDAESQKILS